MNEVDNSPGGNALINESIVIDQKYDKLVLQALLNCHVLPVGVEGVKDENVENFRQKQRQQQHHYQSYTMDERSYLIASYYQLEDDVDATLCYRFIFQVSVEKQEHSKKY